MSELNESVWPFPAEENGESLDIDAIFGGGAASGNDANPFEQQEPPAEAPAEKPDPEPTEASAPLPTPAAPAQESAPAKPAPKKAAAPAVNPIAAAFEQKAEESEKAAAKSLFEKAPIFAYANVKDEITDASITFEELRIAKADDFPELAEGKRVSWSVEYGKVTKQITDPKGTTIQTTKEEIERSKAFLDGLKKSKDKNPNCLIKPRVTAQSKGIASYKGVFTTVEDARASDKPICLIPSNDGNIYEMRKSDLGEFIVLKEKVVDFQAVRAGFTPALPLIPLALLQQIISFFRCYMDKTGELEALAHILWDREQEKFVVHVPKQIVSKARVDADLTHDSLPEDRYLHYADIHSHNSMDAKFSMTDDADEQATRLYIVLGRLDKFFPAITVRMSCGGTFHELDPGTIFEGLGEIFPYEWRENVETARSLRVPVEVRRIASYFASEKEFFAPGEGL